MLAQDTPFSSHNFPKWQQKVLHFSVATRIKELQQKCPHRCGNLTNVSSFSCGGKVQRTKPQENLRPTHQLSLATPQWPGSPPLSGLLGSQPQLWQPYWSVSSEERSHKFTPNYSKQRQKLQRKIIEGLVTSNKIWNVKLKKTTINIQLLGNCRLVNICNIQSRVKIFP